MKTFRSFGLASLVTVLALAPSAKAAYDAFLKLGDIQGESKDPAHMGWIEIESYQFEEVRSSSIGSATSGAGASKVQFNDFKIKKVVDRVSPKLMAAANGQHFPEATIDVRKAAGSPDFIVIRLKVVFVTDYRQSGGGAEPTETFTLKYGSIKFEYKSQKPGRLAAGEKVQAAPGGLSAAVLQPTTSLPKITAASASAPTFGTNVTLKVASTAACNTAFIDWGDGSPVDGHSLQGTSTSFPHTYASPGLKTIRVGGHDASYWNAPQRAGVARSGDCSGEAQTQVTLKLAVAPAPVPAIR